MIRKGTKNSFFRYMIPPINPYRLLCNNLQKHPARRSVILKRMLQRMQHDKRTYRFFQIK